LGTFAYQSRRQWNGETIKRHLSPTSLSSWHNYDKMMPKEEKRMITIKPVSDLRNDFSGIEKLVKDGHPVFLTKNGYGTMVVMSIEQYSALTEDIEKALDEAESVAQKDPARLSEKDVFDSLRKKLKDGNLI
jgi:prevent-host-death family protein